MTVRGILIAASHGTSDANGRRAVSALVEAVARRRPDLAVHAAFVDVQQPDVPSSLTAVPPGPVTIVPLLLSAGYHVHVDLRLAAEEVSRVVQLSAALGPDIRLIDVLRARLELAGLQPTDAVVMAAAGSSDRAAVADCRRMGVMLAEALGREVTVGFLSAAEPRLADAVAAAATGGRRVVMANYLLAPGYFAALAAESGADVIADTLLTANDPPSEALVSIVIDRFEAADRQSRASSITHPGSRIG